ncbi:MAG: nucleotidyltransferase domain-containing protein [Acidimicrobiales bacterium]
MRGSSQPPGPTRPAALRSWPRQPYPCAVDAGETIRRARRASGLSQAGLARRAQLPQSAISRYETNTIEPRRATMARILAACGMARPSSILAAKRQAVFELLRGYGAKYVWVFGSVARGEDDEASDVDILVETDPVPTLFQLAKMQLDLSELLGLPVDVGTPDSLKRDLAPWVFEEAKLL